MKLKIYDEYIKFHKRYVKKASGILFKLLNGKVFNFDEKTINKIKASILLHDESKKSEEEYLPSCIHYYGNPTRQDNIDFQKAVALHRTRNPHHPEYWQNEFNEIEEMPDEYIFEMLCDWWSFSLARGKPWDIIDYYNNNGEKWEFVGPVKDKIEASIKIICDTYKK